VTEAHARRGRQYRYPAPRKAPCRRWRACPTR
jgi:hypothetical protein